MSGLLSTLLGVFLATLLPAASPLTVAAASDLTNLEPQITTSFEASHPGIHLQFVTAASAILRQQIDNGAPYDVFLSANATYVDQLTQSGKLAASSNRNYAVGRLGVLWRDGKSHDFKDFALPGFRLVSLPNPQLAPYGVAAEQALRHAGVWEFVRQKLVYGENVRQTLQLFESGNTDAVITSDALLQGKPGVQLIPADWHTPIVQKAGIVATSPNAAQAQIFLDWLTGPAGQAILAHFGFSPPNSK